MLQISTTAKGIIFSILVAPRSSRNEVVGVVEGALTVLAHRFMASLQDRGAA